MDSFRYRLYNNHLSKQPENLHSMESRHCLTLQMVAYLLILAAAAAAVHRTTPVTSFLQPSKLDGRQSSSYCVPQAWQGAKTVTMGVVSTSGEATVIRTFARMIYSAKQQKMVLDTSDLGGDDYVRRIYDYPGKILYTVRGILQQTCQETLLTADFVPQCVPGNSTVTQSTTKMGVDQNTVTALELSGIQYGFNYHVTVTEDTHVPIYHQLWGGNDGENVFAVQSFYNFTIPSTDLPAILFQPPAICDQVSFSQAEGYSTKDQIYFLPFLTSRSLTV